MTATHDVQSTMSGPRLHLALELGWSQWKLAFTIGHGQPPRLRAIAARDLDGLLVSAALRLILDRDLKAAGIPKRDDGGRTVDVHALRTRFGTLMSKAGVAPRTAQAAMRHSDIKLTMNVYTDPRLLDVPGAVDKLPALPLPQPGVPPIAEAAQMTGTDHRPVSGPNSVAPAVAP